MFLYCRENNCLFGLVCRLCMWRRRDQETDKEAELLAYQISHDVVSGRHPVSSHREGITMAAIMAQVQ